MPLPPRLTQHAASPAASYDCIDATEFLFTIPRLPIASAYTDRPCLWASHLLNRGLSMAPVLPAKASSPSAHAKTWNWLPRARRYSIQRYGVRHGSGNHLCLSSFLGLERRLAFLLFCRPGLVLDYREDRLLLFRGVMTWEL